MRPIAILAAIAAVLYMLGRRRTEPRFGPAPALDDIDWLGQYRSPANSITLDYPANPASTWRN